MSAEEDFKEKLNHILNSREVPFNEAGWEGARKLLDARRRRRFVFYFIWPLGLLLVTGIVWLFSENGSKGEMAQNKETPQMTVTENFDAGSSRKQNENSNKKPETVVEPKAQEPQTDKPELPQKTSEPATSAPVRNNENPNVNQKLPETKGKVKSKKSTFLQPKNPVFSISVTTATFAPQSGESGKANGQETTTINQTAGNGGEVTSGQVVPPADGSVSLNPSIITGVETPSTPTTQNTKESVQSNENVPTSVPGTIVASSPSPASTTPQIVVSTPVAVQDSITKQIPQLTVAEAPTSTNSAETATPDSSKLNRDRNELVPPSMLIAELSGVYNLGWTHTSGKDGAGFNPQAGVYFGNSLTRRISALIGVRYISFSNMNQVSRTSKVTRFKFSEENEVTVITPRRAQYFGLGVKPGFHFNKNNVAGFSYSANFLLTVNSVVETYREGTAGKENYAKTNTSGYVKGFNNFISTTGVFYRRRILNNWWACAEFEYGLNDIRDNHFFNIPVSERITGARLGLMYNFWTKKTE